MEDKHSMFVDLVYSKELFHFIKNDDKMNVFVSELKHYAPGVPIILVGTKLSMFVYVYFDTGIVIHQMLLSCLFMIIYQFHFCLFVLQYEIYKLNPMGFMSGNY